jgi:hypothetical protein
VGVYSPAEINFEGGNKIALRSVWTILNRINSSPVENETAHFEKTIYA